VIADLPLQPSALGLATVEQPDIVVFDPESRAGTSAAHEFICQLTINVPHSNILILTDVADPQRCTPFLVDGAVGLVLKDQPAQVLLKAIKKLQQGEVWLERTSTARLLRSSLQQRHEQSVVEAKLSALTKREREIVAGVCEGLQNRALADRLFISE